MKDFLIFPVFFLVVIPILSFRNDSGSGRQKSWRLACTLLAVVGGIVLALAGDASARAGFSLFGVLLFAGGWMAGPALGGSPRHVSSGDVEGSLELAGPFPARVTTRRSGAESILEFTCEMPADAMRLRVASNAWLGQQRPDPAMTVVDCPGWPYCVTTTDVGRAAAVIDPVLRSIVQRADVIHRGSFLLELRPGVLAVRSIGAPGEEHRLGDWINDCYAIADHLRSAGDTDVRVLEVATREAVCQVCGCAVTDLPVRCGRCGTPHHDDCWEYNGGCSVYACGGRDEGVTGARR